MLVNILNRGQHVAPKDGKFLSHYSSAHDKNLLFIVKSQALDPVRCA